MLSEKNETSGLQKTSTDVGAISISPTEILLNEITITGEGRRKTGDR